MATSAASSKVDAASMSASAAAWAVANPFAPAGGFAAVGAAAPVWGAGGLGAVCAYTEQDRPAEEDRHDGHHAGPADIG